MDRSTVGRLSVSPHRPDGRASSAPLVPTADLAAKSNLSISQLWLWLGQKLNPTTPLYNMILAFRIKGKIQHEPFAEALQAVVNASDAMRTVIEEVEGVPQQRVLDHLRAELQFVDYTKVSDAEVALMDWLDRRRMYQFDLRARLFDTALIQMRPDLFVWYLNQHHLITDGWSTAVVYRRMADFYRCVLNGELEDTGALPPYQDYLEFERSFRASSQSRKAQAYWQERAAICPAPLRLYGKAIPEDSTRTHRVPCDLGIKRSEALRAIATERGIQSLSPHLSLFNIFSTVLYAYLYRVSGNRRLVIGAPSHNRLTPAFKETIGAFIEVFPLYAEIAAEETFLSLLQKVMVESNAFLLHVKPGTSHPTYTRGFNVLLNYIHASFGSFDGLPMQSEWVHCQHGDRGHVLRLQVHDFDQSDSFQLCFDFNCDALEEAQQPTAVDHFLKVMDAFVEDRNRPLSTIDLLSDHERTQLILDFNRTDATLPKEQTVLDCFEEQVSRTPNAIAAVSRQGQWTYQELDARANQLGHFLRRRGVGKETRVGICMTRRLEMLSAILGVLKAGGAYVPIDPSYPAQRLEYLLDDADVQYLLTQEALRARLEPQAAKCVSLDSQWQDITRESTDRASHSAKACDMAYVIYTSGSTGQPKGVVIEHQGLLQYLHWAKKQYSGDDLLNFALFTSLSFDLTVTSIFVPLISGGKIVIYGGELESADLTILQVMEDNAVDIVKLTPSHLALLKDMDLSKTRVRTMILGGEDLKADLARTIAEKTKITLYNEYGPTEAVVGCMIHRFDPAKDVDASVPIGRPADNVHIYLLDDHLTPVPRGVPGEIYISRTGLARGYLNRPDLTAERFVADPFRDGARMYRSGDLARMKADGNLEFLGRTDQQVKIRGVRIEIGEVEAVMVRHPQINECVVDVVQYEERPIATEEHCCSKCGLASSYPGATFDTQGVCNLCGAFEGYRDKVQAYFKNMEDLQAIFARVAQTKKGPYDCLALLSGGKDSTYALYQLVQMGLKVLAFSLDNGYISETAKANIRRVVESLGVDHIFGRTPAMNAIFVDSLKRHSNVCNGCFKTIYTLSTNVAKEKNIPIIVTGLSRGQLFETRLTEELFTSKAFDVAAIDRMVLDARKAYHRVDDAAHRLLDVSVFEDDRIFDEIQFVDFYRYCQVELDEMLSFLDKHAPWIRPADTGRSTNCLINDVGIHVHKHVEGYHNYALPYSWDVRMGHKTRQAALDELNDEIDLSTVHQILNEIGYEQGTLYGDRIEKRLAAYYVSDKSLTVQDLKVHLARQLPEYMVPSFFVRVERMPLTPNGKVDLKALPRPNERRPELDTAYLPAQTEIEETLARIWAEVLRVEQIGVHDNFFDLGGDSIMTIQIVARANEAGIRLSPKHLFDNQTVAELAVVADASSTVQAEQGPVTGPVPLTPIQRWFFEKSLRDPHHWNQSLLLDLREPLAAEVLESALEHLLVHHDALRLVFTQEGRTWRQESPMAPPDFSLSRIDLCGQSSQDQTRAMQAAEEKLQKSLNICRGPLMAAAYFTLGDNQMDRLLLVLHHLAVDGVSWLILLEDLERLCTQHRRNEPLKLPAKTTSFKQWSEWQVALAQGDALGGELDYWLDALKRDSVRLPADEIDAAANSEASAATLSTELTAQETQDLLHRVPTAYHTQVNDVLLTALVHSFHRETENRTLCIDLEGHGREATITDADVSRTVGWFTSLYPVTLDLGPVEDAGEQLKRIKETLRRIPNRGVGFGLLRYLRQDAADAAKLAALPKPDVLFNYMGQLDQMIPDGALFGLARELTLSRDPQAERTHLLEINAWVVRGRLRIVWTYSQNLYRELTVRRLAERYCEALRSLIAHCLSQRTSTYTPTDFPLADLDDNKMKKLAAALGKTDHRTPSP